MPVEVDIRRSQSLFWTQRLHARSFDICLQVSPSRRASLRKEMSCLMVPSGITPNLVRLSGKVIYLLSTAYGHRESTFVLRLSIDKHPNPLRWIRARYPTLSIATPESNEAAKQVGEFIHKLARKPESSCFEDKYRIWRPFHYLSHFRLCVCLYSFEKRTSLCKIRVYPSLLRKQQSLRIFEWRKF